jgi:putative transposase
MPTNYPQIGAQYKLDGQVYEIVSMETDHISLCSLIHHYRRYLDQDTFASMQSKGALVLHQRAATDVGPAAQLAAMPPAERLRHDHRRAYLDACMNKQGGRMPRVATLALIKQVAHTIGDTHPPSLTTLWNWKNRFLKNNCHPLALVRKKLLRRPKRVAQTAEQLIKHYIETVYLKPERPSLTHAYKLMRGHLKYENEERRRCDLLTISIPSYATFRRRVLDRDRYYVAQQREGAQAARRKNRFSGHLFIDNDPSACTIFDTQVMDVMITNEDATPMGRPVLSAHLVPATRECPGWDISIGAPCAEKMMRATIRAIIKNGKMAGIIADHGKEILNVWSLTTFDTLGINPDYVPVGEPDPKAFLERFFGTVNTGFSHTLPGTTKGSPSERGDYPSEERACLTLEQLRAAFSHWIDGVYHQTFHSGLGMSPAEKKVQLLATALPAERYSEQELNTLCLSVWRLRIDNGRVKKKNLAWHGPGLPEVRQRLAPKQCALVYFNPCDLGTVWVAHPDTPQDWHPASATRPDYQNGLALSDHETVLEAISAKNKLFDGDTACAQLYDLNSYIEQCQERHKQTRKSQNSKAKANRARGPKNDIGGRTQAPALNYQITDLNADNLDTYRLKGGHSDDPAR